MKQYEFVFIMIHTPHMLPPTCQTFTMGPSHLYATTTLPTEHEHVDVATKNSIEHIGCVEKRRNQLNLSHKCLIHNPSLARSYPNAQQAFYIFKDFRA